MKRTKSQPEPQIVDEPGMAERFQRGLQRAFTMKPTHPTPKPRPAGKRRASKTKGAV